MGKDMKANLRRALNLLIKHKLVKSKKGLTKALQAMMDTADGISVKQPISTIVEKAEKTENIEELAKQAGIDFDSEGFSPDDLAQGFKVEQEHVKDPDTKVTDDPVDVIKIAWAHLKESKDYYKKLKEMEGEMKKGEDLIKEIQHSSPSEKEKRLPFHGWISPSGDFHQIPSGDAHYSFAEERTGIKAASLGLGGDDKASNKMYKDGWISTGHGGEWAIIGDDKVLHDSSHPATRKLASMVRSLPPEVESIYSAPHSIPRHLAEKGIFKKPTAMQEALARKSEGEMKKGGLNQDIQPTWIDPKGDSHSLGEEEHLNFANKIISQGEMPRIEESNDPNAILNSYGWISTAHMGEPTIGIHSSYHLSPDHPAVKQASKEIKSWPNDIDEIDVSDESSSYSVPRHLAEKGIFKKPTAMQEALARKSLTKAIIKKLIETHPELAPTPEEFKKILNPIPPVTMTKSEDSIDLEHWSSNPFLSTIDPDKHGKGIRGQESERKAAFPESFVGRSYYYSAGTKPEQGLGPFKHKVSIPKNTIYDLSTDPEGFFDKTSENDPYLHRLNQTEKLVRNKGYRGAYLGRMGGEHKDDSHGHVYMMFHPERVQKSEELEKGRRWITRKNVVTSHHKIRKMLEAKGIDTSKTSVNGRITGLITNSGGDVDVREEKRNYKTVSMNKFQGIESVDTYARISAPAHRAEEIENALSDHDYEKIEHAGNIHYVVTGKKTIDKSLYKAESAPETTFEEHEGETGNRNHITANEKGHYPTHIVSQLKGANNENRRIRSNYSPEQWQKFKADIKENGIKESIFITVDHGEKPVISEGNHRIVAAEELGMDKVPVEIRYFGNAQHEGRVHERYGLKKSEELYHGTHAQFEEFGEPQETEAYGHHSLGTYASNSKEFAAQYGPNIHKVAPPKKTLDLTGANTYEDYIDALPIDKEEHGHKLRQIKNDSLWHGNIDMAYKLVEDMDKRFDIVGKLKEQGYDSIKFKESRNGIHAHTTAFFDKPDMKKSEDQSNFNKPSPEVTVDSLMAGEHGDFSILSAEKKEYNDDENKERTMALSRELQQLGHYYLPVKGNYQYSDNKHYDENSFVVFGPHQKEIERLGQKYEQETVIHSNGGSHEMHHVTGKHAGTHHKGVGHEVLDDPDVKYHNYSEIGGKKFRMNFDFDTLHGKDKSHLSKYEDVADLFKAAKAKRGVPPDQLEYILKHGTDEERLRAIRNEGINENHLDIAIKDPVSLIRQEAAGHPKITSRQLDYIFASEKNLGVLGDASVSPNLTQDNITRALSGDRAHILGDYFINRPDLTPEHIDKLLKNPDRVIRVAAARHSNASEDNIRTAITLNNTEHDGSQYYVANAAIENPNATAANLSEAIREANRNTPALFDSIVGHKNFNKEHLDQILNESLPDDWFRVANHPYLTDEHVDKIFKEGNSYTKKLIFSNPRSDRHIRQGLSDANAKVRADAVMNENATEEHVGIAMKDPESSVRMYAAASPKSTKAQAEEMTKDSDYAVVRAALRHPEISPQVLKRVLKETPDDWVGVKNAAVVHPNNDEESLAVALKSSDPYVAALAAEHPNMTPKNIHQALKMAGNRPAREAAASHPNANSENLMMALDDEDGGVATHALHNKNATSEHVDKAQKDPREIVRRAAAIVPAATPEQISRGLADDNGNVRNNASLNPNMNAKHISYVLDNPDKFSSLRPAAMFDNPNHTSEHVEQALGMANEDARRAAARSKRATPEQLDKFMADTDPNVSSSARQNDNLSSEQIQKLIDSRNVNFIRTSLERPNLTHEQLSSVLESTNIGFKDGEIERLKEAAMAHPKATPAQLIKYGNFTGEKEFKGRSMVYSHVKDRLKSFGKDQVSKQEYMQKHPEDKNLPEINKIFKTGRASIASVEDARNEEPALKYLTSEGTWDGMQRHNDKVEKVFRFDVHPDQYNKYGPDVQKELHNVMRVAQNSGHPVNEQRPTIGWARVDVSDKNHWFIDEMQSDVGHQLKDQIQREAKEQNMEVPQGKLQAYAKFADDFKYFGHHMLAHVMEEAHKKGVKQVSIHSHASKNVHLGKRADQPSSTQNEMYEKTPKPAGFKPMPYSKVSNRGKQDLGSVYNRNVIEKALRKALLIKAAASGYKVTPEMMKALSGGKGKGGPNTWEYAARNAAYDMNKNPQEEIEEDYNEDIKSIDPYGKGASWYSSKLPKQSARAKRIMDKYKATPDSSVHNKRNRLRGVVIQHAKTAIFAGRLGHKEGHAAFLGVAEEHAKQMKEMDETTTKYLTMARGVFKKSEADDAFVTTDGDNIGASVARAALKDDMETIVAQSAKIKLGGAIIRDWATKRGANVYIDGGDDVAFVMNKKYVKELDELRKEYNEATGYTVTIGVGESISTSGFACLWGKLNGKDRVVIWDKQKEKELSETSKDMTPEEKQREHGLLRSEQLEAFQKAIGGGQVVAPNKFDAWFKGSKVVDDNGAPLTVHHGTDKFGFKKFKRGHDIGIHFGTRGHAISRMRDLGIEEDDGGIYEAHLNIKNPLKIGDPNSSSPRDYAKEIHKKIGLPNNKKPEDFLEHGLSGEKKHKEQYVELQNHLKSNGYDGLVYSNWHEEDSGWGHGLGRGHPRNKDSYIVFDDSQVHLLPKTQKDLGIKKALAGGEMWGTPPSRRKKMAEFHGWVSPEGEFHKIDPEQMHDKWAHKRAGGDPDNLMTQDEDIIESGKKLINDGWVAVGIAGEASIHGHPDVIKNSRSRQMGTVRALAKKHLTDYSHMEINDSRGSVRRVNMNSFVSTGNANPSKVAEWHTKKSLVDEPLRKEMYSIGTIKERERMAPFHGWVSPEGKFHPMEHNVFHAFWAHKHLTGEDVGKDPSSKTFSKEYDKADLSEKTLIGQGWVGVGIAGEAAIHGHHSVVNDSGSTQMRKIRSLAKKHLGHKSHMDIDGNRVPMNTFINSGASSKSKTAIYRSEAVGGLNKAIYPGHSDWYKEGALQFHGLITKDGEVHDMPNEDDRHDSKAKELGYNDGDHFLGDGGIMMGTTGREQLVANSDHHSDRNHPAVKALRKKIKSLPEDRFGMIHVHDSKTWNSHSISRDYAEKGILFPTKTQEMRMSMDEHDLEKGKKS